MLKPISRDTLTKQATEALRSLILRENLAPGHQLPSERELSEVLLVSRNIVREALSALAAEGLVSREVGKGTFVRQVEREVTYDPLRLTVERNGTTSHARREARLALEMGALEFVVARITDTELDALDGILAAHAARLANGETAIKEDIDFHLALLKATRNPILMDMSPLVIDGLREAFVDDPRGMYRGSQDDLRGHRALVYALRRRDLDLARRVLYIHSTQRHFPTELALLAELD